MCEHKQVSLMSEAEDFGEVQEQVEIDNARILFGGCDTQLCTVTHVRCRSLWSLK